MSTFDVAPNGTVQFKWGNWRVERKLTSRRNDSIVVSALRARSSGFGNLLRRVEEEQRSLVIEKRGTPTAVLLSIRDYVRLAAPEPAVLKALGRESRSKGTDKVTPAQIDRIIKAARQHKKH